MCAVSLANTPKIMEINGGNLVLAGRALKIGQSFLVFSNKSEFKAEIKISAYSKKRFIAKNVVYSNKNYIRPHFKMTDTLIPFTNYSYASIVSQPSAYFGEYFCWMGILMESRPLGDTAWYLKFRFYKTPHYINERSIKPFANFYAEKTDVLMKPFIVRALKSKIEESEYKKGEKYIIYGRLENCVGYPTMTALKIYTK